MQPAGILAGKLALLDIVDQEINALAHNVNGLGLDLTGFYWLALAFNGAHWPELAPVGRNWLELARTGSRPARSAPKALRFYVLDTNLLILL